MKIKTIRIKNFKNIEDMTIECNDGINAFIGKNGTGKSAVFEAVNFVLGETWPSAGMFKEEWFRDKDKPVYIIFVLKETDTRVVWKFDKDEAFLFKTQKSYEVIQLDTQKDSYRNFIKNDERDSYRIYHIGSDRTVKGIMPTSSWTLLGRHFYRSGFFENNKEEDLKAQMKNAKESMINGGDKFVNFINSLNSGMEECGHHIEFQMYDEEHFLKSLEFYTESNGKNINIINEGTGIQNTFIISVFKALSEQGDKTGNPIFIDEPELYLHPHMKKRLHEILQKLSESRQIFYITHSAEFLSYENHHAMHKFYIDEKSGVTKVKYLPAENNAAPNTEDEESSNNNKNSNASNTGDKKNSSKNNTITESLAFQFCDKISFNVAFFADVVFLVEGQTDKIFLEYTLKLQKGINLDVHVLDCNSKDNLDKFYNLYHPLGIKCFVLYDQDLNEETMNALKQCVNKCQTYEAKAEILHFIEGLSNADHKECTDYQNDYISIIEAISKHFNNCDTCKNDDSKNNHKLGSLIKVMQKNAKLSQLGSFQHGFKVDLEDFLKYGEDKGQDSLRKWLENNDKRQEVENKVTEMWQIIDDSGILKDACAE